MIDARAALDYLDQAVVIELSPKAADELDVASELTGTVRAVSSDAIGLGLPEYLDASGDLFWIPLADVEEPLRAHRRRLRHTAVTRFTRTV